MSVAIKRRGLMLVLSSPSGAGKSTLARYLIDSDPQFSASVSVTTRPKRRNEIEGEDYIFVPPERFEEMTRQGAFLEHATVFGNRYGTPKAAVEKLLDAGRDVLFDIDWQGAQQLAQKAKDDLVRVFVLPPSREELERRLKERAPRTAPRSWRNGWRRRTTKSAAGPNMIMSSSMTISKRPRLSLKRHCRGGAFEPSAAERTCRFCSRPDNGTKPAFLNPFMYFKRFPPRTPRCLKPLAGLRVYSSWSGLAFSKPEDGGVDAQSALGVCILHPD